MVYFFGDVHLSCLNPWNYAIGEKIINWFSSRFSKEDKSNYAIFAGDITEKDVNPGDVIDQLDALMYFCTEHFKKVYIVMGNHDLKLYKGRVQHSLKFLKRKYCVEIIETVQDIELEGNIIRCCPFLRVEGQTVEDYYSNFEWGGWPQAKVTVGHWNIIDPAAKMGGGVDVSKMKTDYFALGHIHTRISPVYMGSIAPNNISEYTPNQKRVFKILSPDGSFTEEEIPHFVEYLTIQYPNPVPESNTDTVKIYTVDNCKSVQEAKAFYSDYFVKSIVNTAVAQKDRVEIKTDFIIFEDNLKAVDAWLKESKLSLSRPAYAILQKALKK